MHAIAAGFLALAIASTPMLCGCNARNRAPADARDAEARRQVQSRWGKSLDDLPRLKLVAISAHNENIQNEFTWAFSRYYAVEFGQAVDIEWRDVGGGGSAIEQYLYNIYSRSETSGIDVLWGAGDFVHIKLAAQGVLQPLSIMPDAADNIPPRLSGLPLYDANCRWVGSALSGFGFIYNAGMLRRLNLQPPQTWDDLGRADLADLITLADPTQSSSAAVAYEMIVQSAPSWPQGWAKLLSVLANAKRFADSAGAAANTPALGESLVSTCIDFYAATRVAESPNELAYVSPRGQTAFTPDPIAILKNPPHAELAQRFVDFVLSRRGQALWALPAGHPDGPLRNSLGRPPIRRDVYEKYAGQLLPWIGNPYAEGTAMKLDLKMRDTRFSVLKAMVRAAAIDNREGLKAAREKLMATRYEPARLAEFNRLPDNVSTPEGVVKVAALFKRAGNKKDAEAVKELDRVNSDWTTFFRDKYRRVAQ